MLPVCPRSRTRFTVFALAIAFAAHAALALAAERPELDALGTSPPSAEATARLARIQNDPSLQRLATVSQVDTRFGVPTFVWATRSGGTPAPAAPGVTHEQAARDELVRLAPLYGLSVEDAREATLRYTHDTGRGGVIVAFRQSVNGVDVFRDELKVMLDRGHRLIAASGYIASRAEVGKAGARAFRLTADQAVALALEDFAGAPIARGAIRNAGAADAGYEKFDVAAAVASLPADQIPGGPARLKPVWFHHPGSLEPGYYVELMASSQATAYVVSAETGALLFRHGLIESDVFNYRVWADNTAEHRPNDGPQGNDPSPHPTGTPNNYDPPLIAPGLLSLQNGPISTNDPWLPPGAVETLGNNVDAYADLAAPDGRTGADFRADVTSPNTFDRTYDTTQPPGFSVDQQKAAITQLFYDNNYLHDFYYDAGFNEASGNAQADNYGRGGVAGDPIRAEAQDFSGLNNANMSTPADGGSPRMQMYVFTASAITVHVNAPAGIAGDYAAGASTTFGPQTFDVTGDVVYVVDALAPTGDGCDPPFASPVAGKIALIDRGVCGFIVKVKNAQNEGAIGVIIANNTSGVINMGGVDATITIPTLSISQADGSIIKAQLGIGVNVRLLRQPALNRDGTIDNQVIAHEWGHYISNRLVGNSSGLTTTQSRGMGEGWGDFTALMMTVREEDALVPSNANFNGLYTLGSYALSVNLAPNNSYYWGFRRVPYSIDFTKNAFTFKHITNGQPLPVGPPTQFGADGANNAEVHNIGEVWCTMLWECYASLLRDTGRLTFDQARTRMRDYLVAAYKMTPLSPTITEARDAVLAAAFAGDRADFDLFCAAFARRGAGTGAISPDRFSTTNAGVVESFTCGGALAFVSAALVDDLESCDHDGYVDNSETGTLTVTLKNAGATNLSATSATVTSTNPNVTISNGGVIDFPASQPYEQIQGTIEVHLAGAVGQQVIDLQIVSSDPGVPSPVVASLNRYGHVDEVPSTLETVEAHVPPWTISGTPSAATAAWHRLEVTPTSHEWHGPDPSFVSDQVLVTPPLQADAVGPLVIQFSHAYQYEADATGNYDGGVLELSNDGGATWTDVGGSAAPGYTGTIFVGSGDPLAGRPAYIGTSPGFPALAPVVVNLGATYASQTVRFRFRIGADQSVGGAGWFVEDVLVTGITNQPFNALVPDAPNPTLTAITSDVNPSVCGGKVNLTATVTPATATGTVTFLDGATPLGSSPLVNGIATLSVTFAASLHSLTASYGGDACHSGSTSPPYEQGVIVAPSQVVLTADPSPSVCDQKVTLTANVTPVGATGTVAFFDSLTSLGSAAVGPDGVATLSVTTLGPGLHHLTARYSGDACYAPSVSAPLTHRVNAIPTTTTVTSNANPAKEGTSIVVTATVTPPGVTGQVVFRIDGNLVGVVNVSPSGTAILHLGAGLPVGPHSVTAEYLGNSCYAPSTGGYTQEIVADQPPVVTVTSPNGGEQLVVGADTKLAWTATDDNEVVSVSLYVSRDNGATWEAIATDIANSGTMTWNVTPPGTNTGKDPVFTALFKVVAKDDADQNGEDSSNGPFSIFDFATAVVVTRLDAETSEDGVTIKWSMSNHELYASTVIERAPAETGPWTAIDATAASQGDVTVAVDRTASAGRTYWYRLVGTSTAGTSRVFGVIKGTAGAPKELALRGAWPNPTRGALHTEFAIPKEGPVRISLVDLQGREVEVLASANYSPGRYQLSWDGRTQRGSVVATGMYFIRLHTAHKDLVTRIVIAR